jgi:hypothetical protein
MNLLHVYIRDREPKATVISGIKWPRQGDESIAAAHSRLRAVGAEPNPTSTTFMLFDEAQDTYWDITLWNDFFKNLLNTQAYTVLFCCYGSPSSRPVDYPPEIGTPLMLGDDQRISLWSPNAAAQLYLNETEYNEIVERHEEPLCLQVDLRYVILRWTAGHVGAITDLFRIIQQQVRCFSQV